MPNNSIDSSDMAAHFTINVASENSLIIYLKQSIEPAVSAQVQWLNQQLKEHLSLWLVDTIPSYASVLVIYDALNIDYAAIKQKIELVLATSDMGTGGSGVRVSSELITLPVFYSEQTGPDLARIAQANDISIDDVINIHQQQEYRAYAIGFAPGFCYLGQVDARIATPRLASPRPVVAKGSVAIADQQTAVYPAVSPGGWNIIGLCPVDFFNPTADPVMPLKVGDRVTFEAVSRREFLQLGGEL